MKLISFLLAAFLFIGASLAPAQENKSDKPAAAVAAVTDPAVLLDKVSYYYGTDVARSFKENSVEIKLDSFVEGLKNTLEKKPGKYTPEELEGAMNQFAQ